MSTWKTNKITFQDKEHSSTKPFELVHTDLCGPTKIKGLNGEKYFMLLIDDYTRMTWVCLLNRKSEAFGCFRTFKELVENETGSRIKWLHFYVFFGNSVILPQLMHICQCSMT